MIIRMQFISKVPNGGLVESKFFAERTSAKTKLGKFPNQKCKANRTGDTEHLPTAHTVKISNCSSHIDIVHMEKIICLKEIGWETQLVTFALLLSLEIICFFSAQSPKWFGV